MAPLVRSCCCGCDLRVGTLLIGIFSLLGSAYNAFANFKGVHDVKESQNEQLKGYIALFYVRGAIAIISIIMNTVLIAAAHASKRGPILYWLIWEIVLMVATLGLTIFVTVISHGAVSVIIVVAIIGWVLQIYFLVVVYSFTQSILEEEQNGGPPHTYPTSMGNFGQGGAPPYERLDKV